VWSISLTGMAAKLCAFCFTPPCFKREVLDRLVLGDSLMCLPGQQIRLGSSLSSCVFHCLQARVMTVVTGVLRAGVLRGVGSDAGGGLVGIAIGHKGERGVGKLFWRGLVWSWAGQLGGRRCYKVKRIGTVRDQDVVVESASKLPHFPFTVGWYRWWGLHKLVYQ
jgi:hypothetical protein